MMPGAAADQPARSSQLPLDRGSLSVISAPHFHAPDPPSIWAAAGSVQADRRAYRSGRYVARPGWMSRRSSSSALPRSWCGHVPGWPARACPVDHGMRPGARVRLVAQHPSRPGPGTAWAPASDLQPVHQREKGQGVVALPGAGHPGRRPAPRIGEQVNLAGQPAPRAA
jgi:hypothetical protein